MTPEERQFSVLYRTPVFPYDAQDPLVLEITRYLLIIKCFHYAGGISIEGGHESISDNSLSEAQM